MQGIGLDLGLLLALGHRIDDPAVVVGGVTGPLGTRGRLSAWSEAGGALLPRNASTPSTIDPPTSSTASNTATVATGFGKLGARQCGHRRAK